jgi:hypothetical protein
MKQARAYGAGSQPVDVDDRALERWHLDARPPADPTPTEPDSSKASAKTVRISRDVIVRFAVM